MYGADFGNILPSLERMATLTGWAKRAIMNILVAGITRFCVAGEF